MEAHANPVEGVGKHFMATGRHDHGGLLAEAFRFEMLRRAAEWHVVQLAFEAVEEKAVAAHTQGVRCLVHDPKS
ncbi:hypothetical protein ALP30_200122 [Pseudomonas syringae pv. primulae]|nr:hypothetical protein ALP30_200122 [Pseudomonas syringae pv. primulae]